MYNSLTTVWNDQWYLAAEPCDRGLTYVEATQDQVWNDQWYLAAEPCDRGLTYVEATQDQLWITNEMCNNLEKEIVELETSTADYMDGWTQSVIDLVNDNKGQFTPETQQALDEYLDTLRIGQN